MVPAESTPCPPKEPDIAGVVGESSGCPTPSGNVGGRCDTLGAIGARGIAGA